LSHVEDVASRSKSGPSIQL